MHQSPSVRRQATLLEKLAASIAMLAIVMLSVPPQAYAEDLVPSTDAPQVSSDTLTPQVQQQETQLQTEVATDTSATDTSATSSDPISGVKNEGDCIAIVGDHWQEFTASDPHCTGNWPEAGQTCTLHSDSDTTFGGNASVPVNPIHAAWTAITHGATWIWGENPIADPVGATSETFTKTFTLTALPSSGTLEIAADNSYEVTLNGNPLTNSSSEDNYSAAGQDSVSVPVGSLQIGVNTLTFTVHNFAQSGGTMASNPAGLLYTLTLHDAGCTTPPPPPKVPTMVLIASKVICDDESLLPNWGQGGHGPITATTATDYVRDHPGCHMASGWDFELGNSTAGDMGDTFTGRADWPNGYTAFGLTDATGKIQTEVPITYASPELHVREVLQPGYIPFTHGSSPDNSNNVSAEFYCANDALNYDNWDFIRNPEAGVTYYCVGFNALAKPTVPQTSTVTMCKYDDQQHPLSGWQLTLAGEHVQDLSVDSSSSTGIDSNPLVGGMSYLAKATGTWLNQGSANPVDAEYSTTDNWTTHMDGYTSFGNGILETEINNTDGSWGPYNNAHEYYQSFVQATTGPAHFGIFDGDTGTHTQNLGWFGDNSGLINLNLSKGYTGTTGDNGCTTFTNVPYGTYTAGEVNQPGWTNLSGLGTVTVDGPTETFNVVNQNASTTPQEPTTLKVHIYKYLQTSNGETTTETQVPDNATSTVPQFPMVATWNASNLGSATSSGSYVLGNGHGGAAYLFAADTSSMNAPANYETHEITGGDSPVVANSQSCSLGKYYLVGYQNGSSLGAAQTATITANPTNYFGLTSDQYQIVVNRACPSGDGNPGGGTVSTTTQTIVVHSGDLATSFGDVLSNPSKWLFYNDTTDTINDALGSFVTGPSGQPAGTGSAQITLADVSSRVNLATYGYASTSLSTITKLSFAGYSHSGAGISATESPYLVMNVDFNGSNTYQRRLVYVPADNGAVPQDTWNTYDVINGGTAKWQYSGATWPATLVGPHASMTTAGTAPRTWSEILADYPSARILPSDGHVGVRVGEPGPAAYTGNIDAFVIGITNGTTGTLTTYDFEPTAVVTPTDPGTTGGGGISSFSRSRRSGGSVLGASTTTVPQGQVLGASCGVLLPNFLKMGWKNSVDEVMSLQTFLNGNLSLMLPVSGFFGKLTDAAVRAFQLKYSGNVLTPWVGLPDSGIVSSSDATGFVYKTTQWKINMINCPDLNLPFPTLP